MTEYKLKSPPPRGSSKDLQDEIIAAELKLMSGERPSPREERLLAYTVFAGGCSSCGPSTA
jgi:hypothetical protein